MLENYFILLDLKQQYALDQSKLKAQYLAMQVKFHPDRATNEQERRSFLEKSMKINEAEKILKDDYLRAEYMLKLFGVAFNDRVLKDVLTSDELEEIMEANELADSSEDTDYLQKMVQKKAEEKESLVLDLSSYFEANNLAKALDLTVRLKYLTNLVKNIKSKIKYANSRDL
jgi:molecular chaperone HscB